MRSAWIAVSIASVLLAPAIACDSTTVTSPDPFMVIIEPSAVSLAIGESAQFTATVRNKDGQLLQNQPVTWQIAEPGFASLSSSGRIEGVGAGTTTVTAVSGPASGTADVVVLGQGT